MKGLIKGILSGAAVCGVFVLAAIKAFPVTTVGAPISVETQLPAAPERIAHTLPVLTLSSLPDVAEVAGFQSTDRDMEMAFLSPVSAQSERTLSSDAEAESFADKENVDEVNRSAFEVLSQEFFPSVFAEPIKPVEDTPISAVPAILKEMDAGTLRVIANMTPEQIDALTLLLLSNQDGAPSAADAQLDRAPILAFEENAAWVGDWDAEDRIEGVEDGFGNQIGLVEDEPLLEHPWTLVENSDGRLFLQIAGDPLSRLAVEVGLILPVAGQVESIQKDDNRAIVRTTKGLLGYADRNPTFLKTESEAIELAGQTLVAIASLENDATGETGEAESSPSSANVSQIPPTGTQIKGYVQVGSFKKDSSAEAARASLTKAGYSATIRSSISQGSNWFRVLVPSPSGKNESGELISSLKSLGYKDAFWTRG